MSEPNYRITSNQVAVSLTEHWQPMTACPLGVKVQLLSYGGVAVYGTVNPSTVAEYKGWAPVPYNP